MAGLKLRLTRPEGREYELTLRDIEILLAIGRMGRATSRQLLRLFFRDPSTGYRRLRVLFGAGLTNVTASHSDEQNTYTLTGKGVSVLVKRGFDRNQLHQSRAVGCGVDLHLQYLNDVRVELILATRERPDVTLDRFYADLDLRRAAGERPPAYIPDSIAELAISPVKPTDPPRPLVLILEIDLGSEGGSVFASKVDTTVELWRTRRKCWGAEPGTWRPVVFVNSSTRARTLARLITNHDGGELWFIGALDRLADVGALGPIFALAQDVAAADRRQPIDYRTAIAPPTATVHEGVRS